MMNNSGDIMIKHTQVSDNVKFREGANWMLSRLEDVLSNLTLTVENNDIIYDTKLDKTSIHKIIDKLKI